MSENYHDRPTEIRVSKDRQVLKLAYADGKHLELPAELLRVRSPSAEVRGHGPSDLKLVTGKRGVKMNGVEPVGNYAVRIIFDDGHDTGIYQWHYLAKIGQNVETMMADYIAELDAAGGNR